MSYAILNGQVIGSLEQFNTADIAKGVLATGETVVSIESPFIFTDSLLDVYIDEKYCNFSPESVVTETGKVTLTFPEAKEEDINLAVKVLGTKEYDTVMSQALTEMNKKLVENDFTIGTVWEANTDIGDFESYPFKQLIRTDKFTSESHGDCTVYGADPDVFMSSIEREESLYLCDEVSYSSSGITVLANAETTVELTLRVKGV